MDADEIIECQREHKFALLLTDVAELTPADEDRLFEAGCGDATIRVRSGRVYLTFTRGGPSLEDAIEDAIKDVEAAGFGASVASLPRLGR